MSFVTTVGFGDLPNHLVGWSRRHGEVYRARDTRLAREVALKVLPEAEASDPEWRARFLREARALASVNHPNIAAIYGIEEDVPAQPGLASTTAIVMELVDGETLADRLKRGLIRSMRR